MSDKNGQLNWDLEQFEQNSPNDNRRYGLHKSSIQGATVSLRSPQTANQNSKQCAVIREGQRSSMLIVQGSIRNLLLFLSND